ncbi:MAG: vanadium-dependent haloperoxidase, partial [Stackebrandtia sp.]
FWVAPSFKLYTSVLAEAVARHPGSIARRARLVALFHAAVIDAQIAACDAKYTAYLRWRPVTALRENGRPDWTPLHETPAHPDYPSNHNTYAAAAETVLTAEFGPRPLRPFTIESPEAPGAPRRYTRWRQLTDENIGARIWSGIHTRAADEAGAELGRDTARHALRHAGTLLSA